MKKLAIVAMVALLTACASPYSQHYRDNTGGIDLSKDSSVILSQSEPEIRNGSDPEKDNILMNEDGYSLVGYSAFNAGATPESGAVQQAKAVRASVVILYSKYTNTVSGSVPLTLPNTQTATTTMYGNGYGPAGYSAFSGTANTTIYGTSTTYIPFSVRRSDYLATYWVKKKMPVFGIQAEPLSDADQKLIQSNKGIKVIAVVRGSPAFDADILRGDVIRAVGGAPVYDMHSLQTAIAPHLGKNADVLLNRGGVDVQKTVKFRTLP